MHFSFHLFLFSIFAFCIVAGSIRESKVCVRRFSPTFFANVPFWNLPPFLFSRPLYSISISRGPKTAYSPPSIRLFSNDSQSRHCKIGKKKEGGGAPIFHSKKTCIASFPPPPFDKEHFWTPPPFPSFL